MSGGSQFIVRGGRPLRGRVRVPGDKSIGHRALLFGALARGPSTIEGFSGGEDNLSTAACLRSMGVSIRVEGERVQVEGAGLRGLRMPRDVLDCGNSGTTMRLLAGLLSAQRFGSRLIGDESLQKRPMGRVVRPLRARGAYIAGLTPEGKQATGDDPEQKVLPPLSIAPLVEGEQLAGIEYDMPIASAQVKSCLLLSGLYAGGPTVLKEPYVSRDHTERMMLALGVPLQTMGTMVYLDPAEDWTGGWDGFDWRVPGDLSSAAFPLVAALALPGSNVLLEGVGINPTRTGLLDHFRLMRAEVGSEPKPDGAGNEPTADLRVVSTRRPRPSLVGGELLVRMIDEVPAACALAAAASGTTEIRDAAELRVKESDRIAEMARVLDAFGVPCEELDDGLRIQGGGELRPARVQSKGDHRIAMAAAMLALQVTEGESVIEDVDCVATSFPRFVETFRQLGADIEERTE